MAKCVTCGFLAARNLQTNQLEEVKEGYRNTGESPKDFPTEVRSMGISTHDLPTCFMREVDLKAQFKTHDEVAVLAVINEERDCREWTKWLPESSPKEHREMMDREEWRKWQVKQRRADVLWRIVELVVLVTSAGLFTLLGAWISGHGGSK